MNRIKNPDITHGISSMPIKIVNDFDSSVPEEFTYSNTYVTRDVTLFRIGSWMFDKNHIKVKEKGVVSCDCEDNCTNNCPCKNWTNENIHDISIVLQECSNYCGCSSNCSNRKSENIYPRNIEIFKTKKKGWGVRCLNYIRKGDYIGEYIGELLTNEHCIDFRSSATKYMLTSHVDKEDFECLRSPVPIEKIDFDMLKNHILPDTDIRSVVKNSTLDKPLQFAYMLFEKTIFHSSYDTRTPTKRALTNSEINKKVAAKKKIIIQNSQKKELKDIEVDVNEEVKRYKKRLKQKNNNDRKRYEQRAENNLPFGFSADTNNKNMEKHIETLKAEFNNFTNSKKHTDEILTNTERKNNEIDNGKCINKEDNILSKIKELNYRLLSLNYDKRLKLSKSLYHLIENKDNVNKIINEYKIPKPSKTYYNDNIDAAIKTKESDNDIYEESQDTKWLIVDANKYANFTRFINSSCNENLEQIMVQKHEFVTSYHDGIYQTVRFKRLFLVACRDILPYEELTWNYGNNYHKMKCYCQSINCQYYKSNMFTK